MKGRGVRHPGDNLYEDDMKAPDATLVEKVRLRAASNARIDEAIKTGRKHDAAWAEVELLDKVMRPFSLIVIEDRYREGSDPNEMKEIVALFAANFAMEFIKNVAEKDDVEEAIRQTQSMMAMFADNLATCLQVNYNLTPTQARVNVASTPQTGGSS